jgi:thioredoxin reductase
VPAPQDSQPPDDPQEILHDVIIVGGGPAGLSAALLLGRCGRLTRLIDSGHPRNAASPALHGYLTRDGLPPAEFLHIARGELAAYPTVHLESGCVEDLARIDGGFSVTLGSGESRRGRKLLLATGLRDRIPEIEGIGRFYGHTVHHCPYCDAWEHRGQALGVIGNDLQAAELAMELLLWSPEVTLFTHAQPLGPGTDGAVLSRLGIRLVRSRIVRLDGTGNTLASILTAEGPFPCQALFFSPAEDQQSPLAARAGCPPPNRDGLIECPGGAGPAAPGVFLAGNLTRGPQMIAIATAEGLKAAAAIVSELMEEDQAPLVHPFVRS